jgi:hypothetical protein
MANLQKYPGRSFVGEPSLCGNEYDDCELAKIKIATSR